MVIEAANKVLETRVRTHTITLTSCIDCIVSHRQVSHQAKFCIGLFSRGYSSAKSLVFISSLHRVSCVFLSQGSRHHYRHGHHLRFPRWDGRGLWADDGAGETVPLSQPLHQPVLPATWNSSGQDGADSSTHGEMLTSSHAVFRLWWK